jgi:hypothetical protein
MLEAPRTTTAEEPTDLEWVFRQRFERYLARVYRHVATRTDSRSEIEPLVERILVETLDDWMGPGEDAARAQRVLIRAQPLLRGASAQTPGERRGPHAE